MSHFAIYDSTGAILRIGQCPPEEHENQAGEGEFLYAGRADHHDRIDPATGVRLVGTPPAPRPEPSDYVKARRAAYPPVELQLDWLWHGMKEGVLPKVEPFYSTIAQIKAAYPRGFGLGGRKLQSEVLLPPTKEL